MTDTPNTDLLDIDTVQVFGEERDQNQARKTPGHVDECWRCGRGLTERAVSRAWFVQMTYMGQLVPESLGFLGDEASQGYFPVGSECAKAIPKLYRSKL